MKWLLVLALAGCSMSNQEIIDAVKFCKENDMNFTRHINGINNQTRYVECIPKGETK